MFSSFLVYIVTVCQQYGIREYEIMFIIQTDPVLSAYMRANMVTFDIIY